MRSEQAATPCDWRPSIVRRTFVRLSRYAEGRQTNILLHTFLRIRFGVGQNSNRTKHLGYPHADSKSAALKSVSVRLRPRAPIRSAAYTCRSKSPAPLHRRRGLSIAQNTDLKSLSTYTFLIHKSAPANRAQKDWKAASSGLTELEHPLKILVDLRPKHSTTRGRIEGACAAQKSISLRKF